MGTQHLNTFVMNLKEQINQTQEAQNAAKNAGQIKADTQANKIGTMLGELFPDCNVITVHVEADPTLQTVAFLFQEAGRSECYYVYKNMWTRELDALTKEELKDIILHRAQVWSKAKTLRFLVARFSQLYTSFGVFMTCMALSTVCMAVGFFSGMYVTLPLAFFAFLSRIEPFNMIPESKPVWS